MVLYEQKLDGGLIIMQITICVTISNIQVNGHLNDFFSVEIQELLK